MYAGIVNTFRLQNNFILPSPFYLFFIDQEQNMHILLDSCVALFCNLLQIGQLLATLMRIIFLQYFLIMRYFICSYLYNKKVVLQNFQSDSLSYLHIRFSQFVHSQCLELIIIVYGLSILWALLNICMKHLLASPYPSVCPSVCVYQCSCH